jgi:hypothetical protein
MRDFKCLIYVKEEKKVHSCISANFWVEVVNADAKMYHMDEVELMEYTGLTNKANEELYEGYICRDEDKIGQIIFSEGAFMFVWENVIEYLSEVCDDLEILGNIYEDNFLLGGNEHE